MKVFSFYINHISWTERNYLFNNFVFFSLIMLTRHQITVIHFRYLLIHMERFSLGCDHIRRQTDGGIIGSDGRRLRSDAFFTFSSSPSLLPAPSRFLVWKAFSSYLLLIRSRNWIFVKGWVVYQLEKYYFFL